MVKGRILKSCRCSIPPKIGGKTSGRANKQTCGKTSGATNKKWQNQRAAQKLWQNQWTKNTSDKTSGPQKTRRQHQWAEQIQWATKTSGNTSGHKTKVARPERSKPTSGKTSEGQNLPAICVFGAIDYRTIDCRATYKYKIVILHITRIPYHKSCHCAIIDC